MSSILEFGGSSDGDLLNFTDAITTNRAHASSSKDNLTEEATNVKFEIISKMATDRSSEEYNMNHQNRGLALIFNHENFPNPKDERKGTNKDCADLKNCLHTFEFDVKVYKDYTYSEIQRTLERTARKDHTHNDCILIAIMSHGENGVIYAKDKKYKLDVVFKYFTPDNCPTLAGKPKLFFIQACRGSGLQSGLHMIPQKTQVDGDSMEKCNRIPQKTRYDDEAKEIYYRIPQHADFLLAYSTLLDFSSWRNSTSGSWFIQSLCKEMSEKGKYYDLMTLLTFVSQRVAIDFESHSVYPKLDNKKQIPCINSMLTRILYFPDKNKHITVNGV